MSIYHQKHQIHPNSLKNIEKHKIKPGEVRNPTGKNGWTKMKMTLWEIGTKVVNEQINTPQGKMTRLERIWRAMVNKASRGDVNAAIWVRDSLFGRPMQRLDIFTSEPIKIIYSGGIIPPEESEENIASESNC